MGNPAETRQPSQPRRWFIYSSSGLLIFLCLAIILAAIPLLRGGRLPRTGLITGSSMEPILRGPRFVWTCSHCSETQEFAFDTCKSNQPFRCQFCNKIDFESAVDVDDIERVLERTRRGDLVRFATLRTMRANRAREIANGLVHPSGLKRGDVVVFQESPDAPREIKRLVGFAFEHIAIDGGDLVVNQDRWCKTLEQSLRQSILLNAWERASRIKQKEPHARANGQWKTDGEEFHGVLSSNTSADLTSGKLLFADNLTGGIDNQLAINAHDSHAVIPVQDFGFALQLSRPENAWRIECSFNSPLSRPVLSMELAGSFLTIKTGGQVANAELFPGQDKSVWIVIAMIDGYLVAGSQDKEWLRTKLPFLDSDRTKGEREAKAPIEITAISGSLAMDQLIVFRDIFYRGNGDSDKQSWAPVEQLIVLGDNVSASSDSRDRWPDGLPTNSAKGVVLQAGSPMEVLLRQR